MLPQLYVMHAALRIQTHAPHQRSPFRLHRYVNHSKRRANCVAQDAFDEDAELGAVFLETSRDVSRGEELLFNYGDEYWDNRMPRFSPTRLKIDYF